MKQLERKMENQKGFSLAETLVALVIILLVSGIVAAGMPAAERAYVKVQESADAQVLLSTTLTELRNELATASDIRIDGNRVTDKSTPLLGNTVSYTNPITGETTISFKTDEGFVISSYKDIGGSGERPLVTFKAKTKDLTLTYTGTLFTYKADTDTITVAPLNVKSSTSDNAAQLENPYIIRVLPPAEIDG